jgi:DHA1 family multidrug resistance protein-like MFS transporter
MTTSTPEVAPPRAAEERGYSRITYAIAAAVGTGQLSWNFWSPFLPLYMLHLGARDEADAVFWIATATSIQGVARLVSSPLWGIWADRTGRKQMLIRCLYFASISNVITAVIAEPWQLSISFLLQGLFSGYVPASVALTSVSVPDSRISRSLSTVTGAQYLGNTVGPMIGAVLAIVVGYRGALLFASLLPALGATWVLFIVPRDIPGAARRAAGDVAVKLEPFKPTLQLLLAILVYFALFVMTQQVRLLSPIAINQISDANVKETIGVTFTIGGLASAFSLVALAPMLFRPGKMVRALVTTSALSGVCMLLLAVATNIPLYVLGFALISLVQASMIPATNTLIAGNVSRARRGTAFGWASSAQAVAFMVGPFGAALFVSLSLSFGFVVLACVLFALALLLASALREPAMRDG